MDEQQREALITAISDANMKCDDDTDLYDVQPGCEARRNAARLWLWVTGAGITLTAYDAERARAERAEAEVARLRSTLRAIVRALGPASCSCEGLQIEVDDALAFALAALAAPPTAEREGV